MRKRMPKMFVLILTLLFVMIVTGCGEVFRTEVNEKPDDDISKAIYEAVGRKKVHYFGKKNSKAGEVTVYKYTVYDYEDENLLKDMVEAANSVMKEKEMTEKIDLAILEKMAGGTEGLVSLCNYYEYEDECQQYEALQCLRISGSKHSNKGSLYNKASTYINLPDIKSLVIEKKIAQSAEDEGINWYEIWPELEHYKVLEK
ncbi:MAG: hypothetical protein HDR06_01270 [Lachnospiraceae bacterium]|nr:hypothetical protein [Lachnospiraceae bacterium]